MGLPVWRAAGASSLRTVMAALMTVTAAKQHNPPRNEQPAEYFRLNEIYKIKLIPIREQWGVSPVNIGCFALQNVPNAVPTVPKHSKPSQRAAGGSKQ